MKITLLSVENLVEIGTIKLDTTPKKDDCVMLNDIIYLVISIVYSENMVSLIVRKHPKYNDENFVI